MEKWNRTAPPIVPASWNYLAVEYFGGEGNGTSIGVYPPSGFLNELGPHFSPLSRFYTEGRSRSHLTRRENELLLAAKEFTLTEISRCHCLPLLITNSPLDSASLYCLVIRFFSLHTFSFSKRNIDVKRIFFLFILIRTNISFMEYDIFHKLCRLMSFLLITSDIFRAGEYKTVVYKRERVPVLKIAQRRKVG